MAHSLPASYNRRILKAILEFNLIEKGDRVLVGFSGGKDSSFLLYALSVLKYHQIIRCDLHALTVDLGFATPFNIQAMAEFCHRLDVPFHVKKTQIAQSIEKGGRGGPCAICAHFRRGAMNRFAQENGFNKVALAHHHDDAVETFLMSILYSGQIRTFLPRTELERTGLVAIRPLVYLREREIRKAVELTGFTPVASPCPYDGKTQRQKVKTLLRDLTKESRWVYTNLAAAMREGAPIELWPAAIAPEKRNTLLFKPERD
jgi:tRNA 2-thiocytidine biosynthesis protein TtcA